ncbi:hypothetical protein [Flagellimonas aequoris]|uniref:Uncharacterized protein n=1 Tax=Flagellimonas aequoris TaxID=2306997 RepID=A0A418N4H8_9FLAO|nr:hypothetical protein [Allomuricauda aequoris]RIV68716.1 hypothetical protein D2U88_16130 [Allomuricauda aequoris]TXK00415.1 hypothetical protein FQ019_15950 [Allomuricauda aequoris]
MPNSTIRTIKDYLPVIYIFLVCFGYFSENIYYQKFDIDILDYLSVQELIFIFIPSGAALTIGLLIYFIMIMPQIMLGFEFGPFKFINYVVKFREHLNSKNKKILLFIYELIETIVAIVVILGPIAGFFYLAFVNDFKTGIAKNSFVYYLLLIWVPLFVVKSLIEISKNTNKINKSLLLVFSIIMIMELLDSYQKLDKANNVLEGYGKYAVYVELKKEHDPIVTDENLIFIGQTKDYIFFRRLKDSVNCIYNKNDINEILIK